MRKTARAKTPKRTKGSGSTFLNPRYRKGRIVAYYAPGNLRKSMRILPFRKSTDIFIGPRFAGKKRLPVHGRTAGSADGYYAAMVYGSARAFNQRVLRPALIQNAQKVLRIVGELTGKAISEHYNKR